MSTILKTWLARIEGNAFTKSEANQYAKAVIPISVGLEPHGFRTNLTRDEAHQIREAFPVEGVRLDPATEAAGLAWLQRNGHLIDIPGHVVKTFDHFTFTGSRHEEGERAAYPVWAIHTTTGGLHFYWRAPWQAQAYQGVGPGGFWTLRNFTL